MIRFTPSPEPAGFDKRCRKPGEKWQKEHPKANRPKDFWSPFLPQLAKGFCFLCGYSAMHLHDGTVDHYISCKTAPERAYEWQNYRYASGRINSRKRNADDRILDPFEVEDDWFEVLLPSLQLVLTDRVPAKHRARAEYTLKRLRLQDDPKIIGVREYWYQAYVGGKLTLSTLREVAPLIARAVEKNMSPHQRAIEALEPEEE